MTNNQLAEKAILRYGKGLGNMSIAELEDFIRSECQAAEKMEARVDELQQFAISYDERAHTLQLRVEQAEARVAELEAALRDIAGNPERDADYTICELKMRLRARTALARHR